MICELLKSVGILQCYSYISMFEKVCDFSYFRVVVGEGNPFLFLSPSFLFSSFALNLVFLILYEFLRKVIVLCN